MKITSIRIQQKFSKGDIAALATIEIDHYFIICDIKVIRDSNSKLIDVPAYTDENGDVHANDEIIGDLKKAVKIAYSNYKAEQICVSAFPVQPPHLIPSMTYKRRKPTLLK